MRGTAYTRLERCLKYYRSFRIGRRGSDWFFYSCIVKGNDMPSWMKAVNPRSRTTINNIDWIGIEKGCLTLYAEGGQVLIACISLENYTTCEVLLPDYEEAEE